MSCWWWVEMPPETCIAVCKYKWTPYCCILLDNYWHILPVLFVWIWEQTAIISLYSINWLVCITETECVYCAVRTGYLYTILRSAHTLYLCVLCGSENRQPLFPYTALTDWFDHRDVECLLRGTDWVFIYNSTFCPHSCIYVFCVDLRTNSDYFLIQH